MSGTPSTSATASCILIEHRPGSRVEVAFDGTKQGLYALRAGDRVTSKRTEDPKKALVITTAAVDLIANVEGAQVSIWLARHVRGAFGSRSPAVIKVLQDTMPDRVQVERRFGRGGTEYWTIGIESWVSWLEGVARIKSPEGILARKYLVRRRVQAIMMDARLVRDAMAAIMTELGEHFHTDPPPQIITEGDKWTFRLRWATTTSRRSTSNIKVDRAAET